ncbi:MAG: hypothetical protein Kow0020_07590 [Wenzhouxiangellaceae bacterium]
MVQRDLHLSYAEEWIAERNGTRITLFDVMGRLQDIPEKDRAAVLASPERIARILNDLLFSYGLAEKAIERGLLDDPEVRAELFYRAMYVLAAREREALERDAELDESVYEQQAREYYLAHKDEFRDLEELGFVHVLFRAPQSMKAQAIAAAQQLINQLPSPEALDELDLDPYRSEGIEVRRDAIERVETGRLDPRFAAGLSRMKPGDVAIVESRFGVHVVRLDDRVRGADRSFDEVRDELVARMRAKRHQEALRDAMEAFYAAPLNLAEGAVEKIIDSQTGVDQD